MILLAAAASQASSDDVDSVDDASPFTTTQSFGKSPIVVNDLLSRFCPSSNQIMVAVLAILLVREYWSNVPSWLQHILLLPWRNMVVKPMAKWRRRRQRLKLQKEKRRQNTNNNNNSNSDTSENPATAKASNSSSSLLPDSNVSHEEEDEESWYSSGGGDSNTNRNTSFLEKLATILNLVQTATHSSLTELTQNQNTSTPFSVQVPFLVMLQMVRHSKQSTAQLWDELYASSGSPLLLSLILSSKASPSSDETGLSRAKNPADHDDTVPAASALDAADAAATTKVPDVADYYYSSHPSHADADGERNYLCNLMDQLHMSDWAYLEETDAIRAKLRQLNTCTTAATGGAGGSPLWTTSTGSSEKILKAKNNNSLDNDAQSTHENVNLNQCHQTAIDDDFGHTTPTLTTTNAADGWHLVRHMKTDEPGRVGHYIALNRQQNVAVIAVKGTSALSDMVTDACGVAVRYTLNSTAEEVQSSDERIDTASTSTTLLSCHQGILDASVNLVEDVQPLIEHLFLPAGYRILLVGHSLGAGCACMAGIILRSRIPALRQRLSSTTTMTSPSSLSPFPMSCFIPDNSTASNASLPPFMLEVVAFAPPPILNWEAAEAAAPFITSVVHNDDMIPRSSLSNLVALLRFLAIINTRLEEKGLRPGGIRGAVQLLKMVLVGGLDVNGDGQHDTIMTAQEIFAGLNKARSEVDLVNKSNNASGEGNSVLEQMDHLFVPGRVVFIYEKHVAVEPMIANESNGTEILPDDNQEGTIEAVKGDKPASEATSNNPKKSLVDEMRAFVTDLLPQQQKQPSTTTAPSSLLESSSTNNTKSFAAGAVVTNGMSPVLSHIQVNERMVSDHMPDSYERTLNALLLSIDGASQQHSTATPVETVNE